MKKCFVVIFMVGIICTGCGNKEGVREETEVLEPAFTATSYVTSSTYETISEEASILTKVQEENLSVETTEEENVEEIQKEILPDRDYDFSTCEDAPSLSGEIRELDWSMVFDENCVVIG